MKTLSFTSFKPFFSLFVFMCLFTSAFAQPTTEPQTVDVIYMKDGRVLQGQILIFEEKDGDLTFQDNYGRKYSITREEYKYFEENQLIRSRKSKRDTVVLSRKENEIEFSVGLSYGWYNPSASFTEDAYYLQNLNNSSYYPINLHVGAGKYFNRKQFLGINAEYSIIAGVSPLFNVNGRYSYQYDSYTKNTSSFIPIELGFTSLVNTTSFYLSDTTSFMGFKQEDFTIKTSALNIGIGHGFNFMMKDKRSLALEFLIYKYFILNESFQGTLQGTPNFNTSPIGGKLAFYVNI